MKTNGSIHDVSGLQYLGLFTSTLKHKHTFTGCFLFNKQQDGSCQLRSDWLAETGSTHPSASIFFLFSMIWNRERTHVTASIYVPTVTGYSLFQPVSAHRADLLPLSVQLCLLIGLFEAASLPAFRHLDAVLEGSPTGTNFIITHSLTS